MLRRRASAAATPEPAATETAAPAANEFLPEGCEDVEKPAPKDVGEHQEADREARASPRPTSRRSRRPAATSRSRWTPSSAPITGGSFKYLADKKFFDGTTFHRIVPDFVIQGGDPAGTGEGGPGYSVEEAPPSDLKYTKGIVAMAKTGDEPAGTSGSQFFIVTGAGAAQLTPDYALLGKVTERHGRRRQDRRHPGRPGHGQPAAQVVMKSVTVKRVVDALERRAACACAPARRA